jgi:adsorption protein B
MLSDVVALIVFVTQILLALFGLVFFISGVDDLFIDCSYLVWRFRERIKGRNRTAEFTEAALIGHPEQWVAIMVPAWDESSVIRPMLANTLRTIRYTNYHIFVGTYPNDHSTNDEVKKIRDEFGNVHRIVCPNPGPTCKADCLNWVYQGIRSFEAERGIRFSVFLMEDCEDIVHPLCLKLFNRLIPEYDMIQLPVFPLEREWRRFVSGHYIDEFTEYHGKDIFVRQFLSGAIPAAGVGCGFSRRALEAMAVKHHFELFNTASLTEDYEFGLSIGSAGMRSAFVSQPMPALTGDYGEWRERGTPDRRIAVREYFPSDFRAAVKQKSRWVIGIALQGWNNLGWSGGLGMRYMLARDRKAIVTNEVSLLGYFIVLFVVSLWSYTRLVPDAYHYPPLVEKGSWLWNVLLLNVLFLLNRMWWRFYCVRNVYGWKQGLLALPRQICSNLVNGFATNRALYIYFRATLLRKKIAWDKTAHVLPGQLTLATDE